MMFNVCEDGDIIVTSTLEFNLFDFDLLTSIF